MNLELEDTLESDMGSMPPEVTNFSFPLGVSSEWENFDYPYWRQYMGQRWWWSLIFSSVYVFLTFAGQHWMKDRSPMKLKNPLLAWNIFLALFSITAFSRTLPEMVNILSSKNGGFVKSFCSRDQMTMAHLFYEFVGTWSKVVELGDTFFMVMRKQKMIFLHWYHHAIVLVYTWYSIDSQDPAHRWYMSMNSFIHALMYFYFALRAIGAKIPKQINITITTLQILQMFVGFGVNLYSVYAKRNGLDCPRPEQNITFALLMYSSFLILFLHFFYNTYLRRSQPKSKSA